MPYPMFTRYWSLLLITPPITMMLGYFLAVVITFVMPKRFESTAIIEIVRQNTQVDLSAEIQKLTSPSHLALATHNLNLTDRWESDHPSTVESLADSVVVEQVPGTRLIRIRASHIHREDARDITAALIQAYRSIHEGYDLETIKQTLHDLRMEIIDQDMLVYKLRQEMRGQETNLQRPLTETPAELAIRYENESMRLMAMHEKIETHPFPKLEKSQGGVVIHDAPLLAETPYSPDVRLNLTVGAALGLLLGIPLAFAIMAILHRLRPEPR